MYEFSFTRGEWWVTVVTCVLLIVLTFTAGFLAGSMWQRSRNPVPTAGTVQKK